jgi:hypothetical protein
MNQANEYSDRWIKVKVCLINTASYQAKTATENVSIVQMYIKVDAGCSDHALTNDLVGKLKLPFVHFSFVMF